MSTFSISDHCLPVRHAAPAQALDDTTARRRAVIQALEILHPVVRPLALEITLGPMDPETFGVTPTTIRRLVSSAIPPGVANLSAFAGPAEVEVVEAITFAGIERALTPAKPGWDFARVVTTVTMARVSTSDLAIDCMPSRAVPMLEAEGGRWVVGPVDVGGFRYLPPIRLTGLQEWGDLSLIAEAFWSLWWQTDSAEYTALQASYRALDAAGFSKLS